MTAKNKNEKKSPILIQQNAPDLKNRINALL